MTIFSFINDILYKKKGTLLDKKEFESEFNPWLIQRWISMYSNSSVKLLNMTINKLFNAIDNKSHWYKLFLTTLPKVNYKKIVYIKKLDKDKNENSSLNNAINVIASAKELSVREVKMYIDEYGIDITKLQKGLE